MIQGMKAIASAGHENGAVAHDAAEHFHKFGVSLRIGRIKLLMLGP